MSGCAASIMRASGSSFPGLASIRTFLAIPHDDKTSLVRDDGIRGEHHVVFICADNEQVVVVMHPGRGNGSFLEAHARKKGRTRKAQVLVALEDTCQRQVAPLPVDAAILHRKLAHKLKKGILLLKLSKLPNPAKESPASSGSTVPW